MDSKPKILFYKTIDSGKIPLVFIHGLELSSESFYPIANKLAKENKFFIILVDLLGHGESPKAPNDQYSMENQAISLHETLKSIGIFDKYNFVAHSMGGLVISKFLYLFPEYVKSIIIEDMDLSFEANDIDHENLKRLSKEMKDFKIFYNSKEEMENQFSLHIDSTRLKDALNNRCNVNDKGQFSFTFKPWVTPLCRLYRKQEDMNHVLENTNIPIKIMIVQPLSKSVTKEGVENYKKILESKVQDKNSAEFDFVFVDNASHMFHEEQEDRFINEILPFIARNN